MTWMENIGKVSTDVQAPDFSKTFVWTLPNLFNHPAGVLTPYVASPWFSLDNNKWRLVLVPNDVRQKSRHPASSSLPSFRFVGLYLWMLSPTKNSTNEYAVKLSLESRDCVTFNGYSLCRNVVTYKNEGTGVAKFLPLSVFSEYKKHISPSGYMKIVCSMKSKSLAGDEDDDSDGEEDDDDDDDDDEEDDNEDEDGDDDDDDNEDVDNSVEKEKIGAKSLDKNAKGSTKVPNKNKENTEAEGVDLLAQQFKELFLSGENSDATLKVGECEFPVHRAILAARSGVFASMFEHKMSEKISGLVNIPDSPSDVFRAFLLFLYTGDFDVISSANVCSLYCVADKYEVYDLKNKCVKFMMDTLSVDIICDVIILAFRHSETKLQKSATRFFCKNARDILQTVQWQKYIQQYPFQANELFIKTLDYHL